MIVLIASTFFEKGLSCEYLVIKDYQCLEDAKEECKLNDIHITNYLDVGYCRVYLYRNENVFLLNTDKIFLTNSVKSAIRDYKLKKVLKNDN